MKFQFSQTLIGHMRSYIDIKSIADVRIVVTSCSHGEQYVLPGDIGLAFCRQRGGGPVYTCSPSPTPFTPHPASARSNAVRGSGSFVIINYAETRRLHVIWTWAMVSLDPQNPPPCNYWEYFATKISQRLNVIYFAAHLAGRGFCNY